MEKSNIDVQKLKDCRDAQIEHTQLKEQLNEKKKAFELENEELLKEIEVVSRGVCDIKEEIAHQALAEFTATENKKLLGGIGIRVRTILEYDESTAFSWARLHSVALSLNKKSFESLAITGLKEGIEDLGFVTKKEVPIVTFPKEIKLEGD